MSINWQEILFHFLGGLGLFLYSIKTMGRRFATSCWRSPRFYIDKYTSNPFFGILVGIGDDCPDSIEFRCYGYYSWSG